MQRRFPRATFRTEPGELDRVFAFSGPDETIAALVDVSPLKVRRWRNGTDPVPKLVFEYLKLRLAHERQTTLGPQFGPWAGWRLSKRGDGLESPWNTHRILYLEDAKNIAAYRCAHELTERQAELIERLMIERDFYRSQCQLEAKFGMMFTRLFKSD